MNYHSIPMTILDDSFAKDYFDARFPNRTTDKTTNENYTTSGCGISMDASKSDNTFNITDPTDSSKVLTTMNYSTSGMSFSYDAPNMVKSINVIDIGAPEKLDILENNFNTLSDNITTVIGGVIEGQSTSRYWQSVCYGNGKYVAVVYNSSISAYSTDGINWIENNISDTSRKWYSVCYGNGKYVAVANYSTYSAYSTDGINWIENTISDTNRYWQSVCYGNGKFVAIAKYSTISAYSTDGITWVENAISDTSRYWSSVCYGNGKYVAVADSSTYSAYSTDGINWIETTISDTIRYWWSVCYGNGKYVAVSNYSTYSAYSTDGINWIETTISDTIRYWWSVCYGNGKYVAIAYDSTYSAYSTDGINWIETDLSYKYNLFGVCNKPGTNQFVACGDSAFVLITLPDTYSKGTRSTLSVNYSWENAPEGFLLPYSYAVTEGTNIVVDTYYNDKSVYMTDNYISEWTENTISDTSRYWRSVCYGNGKYVAIAWDSTISAYSTDGINWIENTISDTSREWLSVCYGNGKYVAVADNSKYSAYSTDGINWIETTISSTSRQWYSVCYGNGKYVAIAYSTISAYSTDGITWVETTISDTSRYWQSVCYGNGKYVAVGMNGYSAYSTDGINWIENTISDTIRYWWSVCYGNGKYVAIAYNDNYYAYSTDGITWVENTISDTSRYWWSVCYGNGKYVAIAWDSTISAYSTDGINWIENTISDTKRYWIYVCYGNGKYVAVAHESTYSAYSTDIFNYLQFSGWDHSDFNITEDTIISGTWKKYLPANFSELSVGSTFTYGKYQVENEDPWDIEWEVVHQDDDYIYAQTKDIIDLRSFDAMEPNNTDSNRKSTGNNNWGVSNIAQFLNSDEENWYSAQHQYDAPPTSDNVWSKYNPYDTHKGFLYYFNDAEKYYLQDMTLTLANNTVTDGGGSYTWTGKVWLPTYTQMGGGTNNSISEGTAFSKYTNNNSRIKYLHDKCAKNNPYCIAQSYASGKAYWYWMSSALPSYSNCVRYVYSDGTTSDNYSARDGDNGLAPCIKLPRNV